MRKMVNNKNFKRAEKEKLNQLVDKFSIAMKKRLSEKVDQGYKNWNSEKFTKNMIIINLGKEIYPVDGILKSVDIANYAMFLWNKDQ